MRGRMIVISFGQIKVSETLLQACQYSCRGPGSASELTTCVLGCKPATGTMLTLLALITSLTVYLRKTWRASTAGSHRRSARAWKTIWRTQNSTGHECMRVFSRPKPAEHG